MITRLLSALSDTPKYEKGMKAYDVHFRTPDIDRSTAILIYDNNQVDRQIRETLYTGHPDVTDYTFTQFDYLDFQWRTITQNAYNAFIGNVVLQEVTLEEADL